MRARRQQVAAALAAAVVAGAVAIPAFAAGSTVKVGDDYFVKDGGVPTVTVKKGATVRWQFAGRSVHNVTVVSGPARFHSKNLQSGTFSRKLTKPGTYKVVCTIHGAKDMSMTLKVR